jgi:ribonuclease HI
MSKYYCDGSTYKNGQVGQDSSFLVLGPRGGITRKHLGNYSINYAELSAIKYACKKAKLGDTVYSDSKIALNWVTTYHTGKKQNFYIDLVKEINNIVHVKGLSLEYIPRDYNLAGIEIEECPFYESTKPMWYK